MTLALITLLLCQDPGLMDQTKVSMLEAIDKGMEEAGEGFLYHAELEMDKDGPVYSIDIYQGDGGTNVIVSAVTGEIVRVDPENADKSEVMQAVKIDLREMVRKIEKKMPGGLVDAQMRMKDGEPQLRMKAVKDGQLEKFSFDGKTGRLIDPNVARASKFTTKFVVEKEELQPEGRNPFFILEPGYRLVLEAKAVRKTIEVLRDTREIDGVVCGVVETQIEGDEVIRIARGFYAISERTNDVFCFGREVENYKEGEVANTDGSWLAGEKKAKFGLAMPGSPLIGARFQRANARKAALEQVLVESVSAKTKTPLDSYKKCLQIKVTDTLKQKASTEIYARGAGLARDGDFVLFEVE